MTQSQLLLQTYRQMLAALASWLRKAQADIAEADVLMAARLASDMFPLSTQVRFACVQAREGVHRLRREEFPPALDQLRAEGWAGGEKPGAIADALVRIDETLSFLDALPANALDSGGDQPLALELPGGVAFDFDGDRFTRDWALPQFYFHIMAAYAILRHAGVALGKADYAAHMFAYLRSPSAPA